MIYNSAYEEDKIRHGTVAVMLTELQVELLISLVKLFVDYQVDCRLQSEQRHQL